MYPFLKENFLVGLREKALPFIFLPLHLTKHTKKSFYFHFIFKVFYSPYFTFKQTHPSRYRKKERVN